MAVLLNGHKKGETRKASFPRKIHNPKDRKDLESKISGG